jgi:hypothetical protein
MISAMRMPDIGLSPIKRREVHNDQNCSKTLIINTSIENAKDVNRIGVALPLNYEGNIVGDHVVVQHNVFRTYFDGSGKL